MGTEPTTTFDSLDAFLMEGSPGDAMQVSVVVVGGETFFPSRKLTFYCPSERCLRLMEFGFPDDKGVRVPRPGCATTLNYFCKYCESVHSITLVFDGPSYSERRTAIKIGEWPTAGLPLSKGLVKLAGTGGNLLKKGYRAELDKLGIGAFAYYRRVIEILKDDLLRQIRAYADQNDSSPTVKDRLDTAIRTRSFENSLKRAGLALPRELFVDGKNPLLILHELASVALHSMSDQECLTRAALARETLEHTVERLELLTKNPEKLRKALGAVEKATHTH